jgi:multiple antibiotic resistance protein
MDIFLATFSALFTVVNPFGAIPIFLSLTHDMDRATKNTQALKTAIYMSAILITFFFAGKLILNFFSIRIEDIRIAGGLLICSTAFNMLKSENADKGKQISKRVHLEGLQKQDISFTPMAMPMLSGPGSIALIIGIFDEANAYMEYIYTVLAVITMALLSYLILRSSGTINRFLGKGGMAALTRMIGFIVLSIGISMVLNGLMPLIKNVLNS